jgi:hypothetical protein
VREMNSRKGRGHTGVAGKQEPVWPFDASVVCPLACINATSVPNGGFEDIRLKCLIQRDVTVDQVSI